MISTRRIGWRTGTAVAVMVGCSYLAGCGKETTSRDAAPQMLAAGGAETESRSSAETVVPRPPQPSALKSAEASEIGIVSDHDATGGNARRATASDSQPIAQPIYRPSDHRPRHNDAELARRGVKAYESQHLKLYTDISPKIAQQLPPLIDLAYVAWERYLGPLPPDREGRPFQITGYLMSDQALFEALGLIPENLPVFINGRHRDAEFWMIDQPDDYYRRHLMIHEATHCFMTIMPETRAPIWYLEGMAERFGTHRVHAEGTVEFGVMPDDRELFPGLGRIRMIQDAVPAGRAKSMDDVARLKPDDFLQTEAYAWSWALCEFLGKHPRYRDHFRELSRNLTGSQFERAFRKFFNADLADLNAEWTLFVRNLQHGYDHERAAIDLRPGRTLSADAKNDQCEVRADRGWQSSGLRLEAGQHYCITAGGRVTLALHPKPWESEPQGITIRYWNGQPLGLLLGRIHADAVTGDGRFESIFPIGRRLEFRAPVGGTLYLRVNDSWSELADNSGSMQVQVEQSR